MKWLRSIGLFFALAFISNGAFAQVGDLLNNFSVGVNVGVNLTSAQFSPSVRQNQLMGTIFGVSARYISEKYFDVL